MNASPADPAWEGPTPLAVVVVDLDDTFYPQSAYLSGAVRAVGTAAYNQGLDSAVVRTALAAEIAAGSDTGGTIDRALLAIGVPISSWHSRRIDLVRCLCTPV